MRVRVRYSSPGDKSGQERIGIGRIHRAPRRSYRYESIISAKETRGRDRDRAGRRQEGDSNLFFFFRVERETPSSDECARRPGCCPKAVNRINLSRPRSVANPSLDLPPDGSLRFDRIRKIEPSGRDASEDEACGQSGVPVRPGRDTAVGNDVRQALVPQVRLSERIVCFLVSPSPPPPPPTSVHPPKD